MQGQIRRVDAKLHLVVKEDMSLEAKINVLAKGTTCMVFKKSTSQDQPSKIPQESKVPIVMIFLQ